MSTESSVARRSEEHTSELQSPYDLVCRLLLENSRAHPDLHSFPTRRSSDLISRMPALMAWTSSPSPGAETTSVVCEALAISTSSCPTPTVSMRMYRYPAPPRMSTESSVARAIPPSATRVSMLRMCTPSSEARSFMRMRSPMIAPPEYGLDG